MKNITFGNKSLVCHGKPWQTMKRSRWEFKQQLSTEVIAGNEARIHTSALAGDQCGAVMHGELRLN